MRRLVWAWVAGTVVFVVTLMAGALLVGAVVARSDAPVATWPLVVVPGLLGGAVAAVVATARSVERPPWHRGLLAAAVPAATAAGLSLASVVEASTHADVPVVVQAVDVLVPLLVLLGTGAALGLRAHVRWAPSRSSYLEVV